MDFSHTTFIAYICASLLSLALTATCVYQTIKTKLHSGFIIAAFSQTLWLAHFTAIDILPWVNLNTIFIAEVAHYLIWLAVLFFSKRSWSIGSQSKGFCITAILGSVVAITLSLYVSLRPVSALFAFTSFVWLGLLLALLNLLSVEQLYRNIENIRLVKLFCFSLFIQFLFDIYMYTQTMLEGELNDVLLQARATVLILTSLFMGIGALTLTNRVAQNTAIKPSRPLVFYSSSLTLVGCLFMFFAVGGYYVQKMGGSWGTVIYTTVLLVGLTLILIVFGSQALRKKISVLINKHLFSHKYDYREEWLKIINQLSQPTSTGEIYSRASRVMIDIFQCDGCAIWLKRENFFTPTSNENITGEKLFEQTEPANSAFIRTLEEQEWVFCAHGDQSSLLTYNQYIPSWINRIENFSFAMPLICDNALIGFAVFAKSDKHIFLNWEDLDLIKTVGRQVASYIERNEKSEQLSESRQFETFNKLSAFVMHDLKNLIAQQSLVVTNAQKHKDNPVFIDDAINTVTNSVSRMNNLLSKLQQNEPDTAKTMSVKSTLMEAVKRCQKTLPSPTVLQIKDDWKITADPDSLCMTFTHIIQNAQDATENDGYVDISASAEDNVIHVKIEDNGKGMSQEFINTRLFKPFETTKAGKGMGIGVFQAREYILSLGGKLSVESEVDEGTTMIIKLPIEHS